MSGSQRTPECHGPQPARHETGVDQILQQHPGFSIHGLSVNQLRLSVLSNMLGSFTSVYLTLISIIQGAAFGYGVLLVQDKYSGFGLSEWLLVLVTGMFFIAVWHEYVYMSVLFSWVPGIKDAAFPFALGAVELLLVGAIPLGVTTWLRTSVAALAVSFLVLVNTNWRVFRDQDFNVAQRAVLGEFPWWHGPKGALAIAGFQLICAVILAIAAPSVVNSATGSNLLAAAAAAVGATYYLRLLFYVSNLRKLRRQVER